MNYANNTREYAECAARKAAKHLSSLGNCSWGTWQERRDLLVAAINDDDYATGALEALAWIEADDAR